MDKENKMPLLDSIVASIEDELVKMDDLTSLIDSKIQRVKIYSEPESAKIQGLKPEEISPDCFVTEMRNKLLRFSELNGRLEFIYRHLQEII